jgi:hypothetical protein
MTDELKDMTTELRDPERLRPFTASRECPLCLGPLRLRFVGANPVTGMTAFLSVECTVCSENWPMAYRDHPTMGERKA